MEIKIKFAPGDEVYVLTSYKDGVARYDMAKIGTIEIRESGIFYKVYPNYKRTDAPPIFKYVNEDELLTEDELRQHTISKIEQEISILQKRLREVRDGE